MDMQSKSSWWNHITETYDLHGQKDALDFTAEEARQYIPQSIPSLGIYECYLALGETPFEAMLKALEAHLPKESKTDG